MKNEIARILIYGDLHLSDKNYGAHFNYPEETLGILGKITKVAQERNVTHMIGLGDLTFARIKSLEYREKMELYFEEHLNQTNGNSYHLKGNHDSAGYGMTEFEYNLKRGHIKAATHLQIGCLNLSMLNYDEYAKKPILAIEPNKINALLLHDFVKFADTPMLDMGSAIELDNISPWCGLNYIIAGHIHEQLAFSGGIIGANGNSKETLVYYPGSPSRPQFKRGLTPEQGKLVLLKVYEDATLEDNNEVSFEEILIDLLPLGEAFNLDAKTVEAEKAIAKASRIELGDVVKNLSEHQRAIGNPEDIIKSLKVPDKYKNKAIEYLKLKG